MLTRLGQSSPWLMLAGLLALLAGLAWDAVMHFRQPDLVEHESVLTLSNPAHLLFATGIALIILGMLLFLLGRASDGRSSLWRRAMAVALALGLFVCSSASFTLAWVTSAVHTHHGDPATASEADQLAAAQLVNDSKTGAARFADFKVALAEGYKQITPFRFGSSGPAHFHNQAYNTDGKLLDPNHPEDLVYYQTPNGRMILIGVMYLAPRGQGPRVGGPLTNWHAHDNLCFNNQGMIVALTNIFGQCPNGTIHAGNTQEMLHVWLYDNPEGGPFSENLSPKALAALVKQASRP